MYTHVVHGFEPIYGADSRILLLGSLPSVKSRENNFYYGNVQNRFWRLLAMLFDCEIPDGVEEKKLLLKSRNIALWDVVAECDISLSKDASIKNVVPTDLSRIFKSCDIQKVFANGSAAARIYNKYQKPLYGKEIITLPSTSPANASYSLERLAEAWRVIM